MEITVLLNDRATNSFDDIVCEFEQSEQTSRVNLDNQDVRVALHSDSLAVT